MKKLNVEKSTLKWIVIWFAVCCFSFIAVMAADFSFSNFYSNNNGKKLSDQMWDGVLQKLESMKTEVFSDVQDYMIPSGTIIMYNWSNCPNDKWERWYWDWGVSFITPLQAGEANFTTWWSSEIQILLENLPKHSHYVVWGYWNGTLDPEMVLSSKNYEWINNNWDADYSLAWALWKATMWKSSEVGSWKAIEYTPKYIKVLFCKKK